MDTLLWRFGHFIKITKNAKNAIFQFSTRFLKIFQSTLVGLLYLIKNVKPSSTRTYPKPAWLFYPRLSNSPHKVYPMWRDSRYMQLKIERINDKQVVDKLQIASDKKIIPCKVPTYLSTDLIRLHPEWQKKFLYLLCSTDPEKKEKRILNILRN